MFYAIIALLIVSQAVREYFVQKERAQLLDRIMSKSFDEFKNRSEKPEENQLEPLDDGTEELESAKDEIINGKEE
jgi:hypothetical protein